jgi:phenylpropionate dioxygenase-like ring-hydroxylating dioxygenase large terminal subunit
MSETQLDDGLVARLTAEMAYEFARTGPPEGFPRFPDIPSGRYTSQEFFDLEQEHLWRRVWVVAGRIEDLPEPGDYFLFEELGIPLIVIRGRDGQIRCFSNTCRHRGAPVVRETTGNVKHMRCQYHSWTYGIDAGDLVAVPDERDFVGLCREERSLPQMSCETWGGWVWINLDPDASPLLDFLGKIPAECAQFKPENLRLVATDHRVLNCNWKVAVEAFQEVYHFRFIHDRGGFTLLDSRGATMGLLEGGNSRMVVPFSKEIVEMWEMGSWENYLARPEQDGLLTIPTVHPIVHSTSYSFTIFPNFITPLGPIGFPVLLFFPVDVGHTNLRIYHYAPDWGDGAPPKAWDERIGRFAKTIDEDVLNLDPMQRAMESPTHTGTPLCYQERRIWNMNEVIDRTIGIDAIPPGLRVEQLLGAYIER